MEKGLKQFNKMQEEKLLKEIRENKEIKHLEYKVKCVCNNYRMIIRSLLEKNAK